MKAVFILLFGVATTFAQATPPSTQATALPLKMASATVLAWSSHNNEAGARFKFQSDLRQGVDVDGRSGDLRFDGKPATFCCQKHTMDRSSMVDLGEKTWAQIDSLPAQLRENASRVPAITGHVYLIHIDDTDVDFWALVRAVKVVDEDHCDLEWVRLDQSKLTPAPQISAEAQAKLASLLTRQDDNTDGSYLLKTPRIVLQLRSGADGGNPNRIDMAGHTTAYVDSVSTTALKFDTAPKMDDRSVAYFDGGQVPRGKCLIIRSITYSGTAKGDTNGPGQLIVHVGKIEIVNKRDVPEIGKTKWEGRVEIRHGQESLVYLEVANSSSADVLMEGDLVDDGAVVK
jgi:hypothetical protein